MLLYNDNQCSSAVSNLQRFMSIARENYDGLYPSIANDLEVAINWYLSESEDVIPDDDRGQIEIFHFGGHSC